MIEDLSRQDGLYLRQTLFDKSRRIVVKVGSAVLTAVLTTVVGFLPVFTMEAAEGKLFKPLAYTKTFAMAASALLAITAGISARTSSPTRRESVNSQTGESYPCSAWETRSTATVSCRTVCGKIACQHSMQWFMVAPRACGSIARMAS